MPVALPSPNFSNDFEPAVALGIVQRGDAAIHESDIEVAVGRNRGMARLAQIVRDHQSAEARRQA